LEDRLEIPGDACCGHARTWFLRLISQVGESDQISLPHPCSYLRSINCFIPSTTGSFTMAFKLLAFASTLAFASAQSIYTGVYGLGYWNETYAVEANQNPNNTKSVPFQIGTQNYTFQVNVAEFTPTGPGLISIQNPRQAASFYNLIWSGDEYLNDTLENTVTSTGGGAPQLCVTVHTGPIARSVTNNYREQDNGDCSHAFGKQCMDDLKKVSPTYINSCNALWMPKSCISKFGDGDLASTSKFSTFT
jgi:hypothetical protein